MKTTDLLTFFQPEESSGTVSTFSIQASDGPAIEVWMFAREKVNLSRFANTTTSSDEERSTLHQELFSALQPGGGLLAYARPHNEVVKVRLFRAEIPGYAPPKRMLRLSPSGDAQFENITGNADLEIGEHLLLPVSKDAEARLSALRDNLKGLPADLESSVLNIIRRPSLEWRIERIERTLSMPPATRAEQQRSRARSGKLLDKLYDLVMRPIPIGPAIAAALLLMAGSLFAYDRFFHAPKNEGNGYVADPGPPKVPTPAGSIEATTTPKQTDPKETGPGDLKTSLDALFKALSTADDPIKGIYESHFKDHQKDAFKFPNIAWGITKLQALQLGFIKKDNPSLKDVLAWSDTEKVYRNEGNLSILKSDQNAVDLLAYTWCQQNKAPSLPATPKYAKPLPLKGTCDDVKPDDAISGLEALTEWVNEQKK